MELADIYHRFDTGEISDISWARAAVFILKGLAEVSVWQRQQESYDEQLSEIWDRLGGKQK